MTAQVAPTSTFPADASLSVNVVPIPDMVTEVPGDGPPVVTGDDEHLCPVCPRCGAMGRENVDSHCERNLRCTWRYCLVCGACYSLTTGRFYAARRDTRKEGGQ